MTRKIPKGIAPGHWWPFGEKVFLQCPLCQEIASLDHEIKSDGTVLPSVQCPREGCRFHEMIVLEGWAQG